MPLTKEEVERLGIDKKTVEVSYNVGDTVVIVDGPLEDSVGTVMEIDKEKNYVKVEVSMFGRKTPVELELSQVQVSD